MNQDLDPISALIELAKNHSDGVIIVDNQTQNIVYINPTAQQITSLNSNSSLADLQCLMENLPAEDRTHILSHIQKVVQGSRCTEIEFRFQTGDGVSNICASAYPLLKNLYTLIFIRDITKNKAHENYLIEFGTKKNTTLDGVVHFISGALSLMRNLSEEAMKSVNAGSKNSNIYLGLIDKNISHCLEVVNDLLIEEHAKSPEISVKKSRVNVVDKINYIIDNLRSSYKNRTFRFRYPPEEILAEIDEIKVLQIINNLAFNAIKFSSADSPITIGIVQQDDRLSIYVADSGIGIPAELKPHIFERNTIAGRRGLDGEASFGKGLSICKELARLMNGEVSFESNEGKGSIFYLTLPMN